ncbi:primase-helicase family protein [Archangium lansingense]|uniref:primase-helicase family protein n=1 Tax=Archangium lansingense TaxID=2995310 RepID=UPI003B76F63D
MTSALSVMLYPSDVVEVRRRLFETEVFAELRDRPSRLSSDLLTALASIIKASANGIAAFVAEGKIEFEAFFASDQCSSLYDAAPAQPVSFIKLQELGAPSNCCPVVKQGPLHQVLQELQFEWEAQPDRFLFDTKHNGYIERDDDGEWDTEVTAKKTFEEHWNGRFADMGRSALNEFYPFIRRFSRRGFFPDSREPIVRHKGIWHFNEYRPSQLQPAVGDWSDYDALTLHLVGGDSQAQDYLLDQLAMPLQRLANEGKPLKTGIIPTLYPAHGSGKQLLYEALFAMYGESNCAVLDQDRLDSKFTGVLKNKLFVVLNETMSDTNRSRETANKLKAMATDTRLSGEAKHVEAGTFTNLFNLLNCTNDPRPLILERGDRRNVLFYQDKPLDRELGRRIAEDRQGPRVQLAAFFAHLLERDAKVEVGDIYETDARKRQLRECEASDLKFWREVQEDGWLSVSSTWVVAARRDEVREPTLQWDGKDWVPSDVACDVYKDWCRRHQLKPTGGNRLWDALREVIPAVTKGKPRQGGVQVRAWAGIPMRAPDDTYQQDAQPQPALGQTPQGDDANFSDGVTQLPAVA